MVELSTAEHQVATRDIFFYIPNLIGYLRVITALISFVFFKSHQVYALIFYGISGFLDAFDGYAARKYNQGTRFGAVLDMVTDRCATSSLVLYLAIIYPQFALLWQILVSLDLSSHYMHMYALLSLGSSSHKNVTQLKSKLLSLYYNNRTVLFVVCLVNELFYVALYLHYYDFFLLGTVLSYLSAPIWFFKQIANIVQLRSAALTLAKLDADDRSKKS